MVRSQTGKLLGPSLPPAAEADEMDSALAQK